MQTITLEVDELEMERREVDAATLAVANAAIEFFDTHEEDISNTMEMFECIGDDMYQVRALIGALNRKRHALQAAQQH